MRWLWMAPFLCLSLFGIEKARGSAFDFQIQAMEYQMLQLVNAERARVGLPAFVLDPALSTVARGHSADMAQNGFFDHTSPFHGTAKDRIRRAGLPEGSTSENIALASSVEEAHQTLMASPPHREHILTTRYDHIGIGLAMSAQGRLLATQVFRGGPQGSAKRTKSTRAKTPASSELVERDVDVRNYR